ncbi:MAG: PAS domain S-box protein, partial [Rhodospirillaceae bacterium]|nr:PAS domain S-box protein [Rhodospirillaceae bacterium]
TDKALKLAQFSLDHTSEPFFISSRDARVVYVNEAACESLRYSRDELQSLSIFDIDPSIDRALWDRRWGESAKIGKARFETRHKRKDGSIFPVEIRVNTIDFEGEEYHFAVAHDITGQKDTLERLRQSEERFQLAVKGSTDGIWDWDIRKGEGFHSDRWCELLGYGPGELPEKYATFANLLHPDDKSRVLEAIHLHLEERVPYEEEMRLRTKSGNYKWFLERGQAQWDADGKPLRMSGSISDINQRKRAENDLRRANRALTVLGHCAQTIVEADDEFKLLEAACRVAVEEGGYQLAWVGTREYDPGKTIRPLVQWGGDEEYIKEIGALSWDEKAEKKPPAWRAIQTARPAVFNNLQAEPDFEPWRELAEKHGYAALISLPLIVDGEVIATYALYAPEADAFDDQERDLLLKVAENISLGIQALRERAAREEAERMLRLTLFSLDHTRDSFLGMTSDSRLFYVNEAACKGLGYAREELLNMTIPDIDPHASAEGWPAHWARLKKEKSYQFESTHKKKDGTVFPVEVVVNFIEFEGEEYNFASVRDITRRNEMEERLRQAQKLEVMGQVTGGVAHEFNNMLMGIQGNLELIGDEVEGDPNLKKLIEAVLESTQRGKNLTRDLMVYSRQRVFSPQRINPRLMIEKTTENLSRLLGETYEIKAVVADDVRDLFIDAHELEGALLNLAVNARDAMAKGGVITVEVKNVSGEKPQSQEAEENQVVISLKDNGEGMAREVLDHVFDPFFTTKEVGKGTGLGLSMVFGFTKQSGGRVEIQSHPGEGTIVSMFFPVALGEKEKSGMPKPPPANLPRGNERVLLVEDDPVVREIGVAMLESLGYGVAQAENGAMALKDLDDGGFQLLLTDVVMPGGMSGVELAEKARALMPEIRVLLCTGYNPEDLDKETGVGEKFPMILKPYRKEELALRVRETLDALG